MGTYLFRGITRRHFWLEGAFVLFAFYLATLSAPPYARAALPVSGGDPYHEDEIISRTERIQVGHEKSTGAFSYSYPLSIPPGRNGLRPGAELSYSSNDTSEGSFFGYGWSVPIPYVERINRDGVEKLYTRSYFYSSLDGELASSTANYFAPRVENGDFRQYYFATSSSGWTVTDKSGTVYTFGSTAAARQDNPNATGKVYKWMLEKVEDTNHNFISYSYYKDKGQIYPDTITYTGNGASSGMFSVVFSREARTDIATSTASGFAVVTRYRINQIQAQIGGSWVHKYDLAYTTGDNGTRSLLDTITETGKDEAGSTIALPATDFNYQAATTTWSDDMNSSYNLPYDLADSNGVDKGVRFDDVNGDGLTDILRADVGSTREVRINKGDGTGWVLDTNYSIPRDFTNGSGLDSGLRTADVNGDGFVDLIHGYNMTKEVYINNGDNTGWTLDSNFVLPLVFTATGGKDTGLRIADANGDGLPDLIQGINATKRVFINKGNGTGWYEDSSYTFPLIFVDDTGGPTVDQGVRLADVNSDGLVDVLRGISATREVYINNGDGTWSKDTHYSFTFDFISGGNDEGVRLADVNGDGFVDIARGRWDKKEVFINNGNGTGWTQDTRYILPTGFTGQNGLDEGKRLADINGDGLADIMHGVVGGGREVFLRNGSTRSDVLVRAIRSEGGRTLVTYKSAQQYTSSGKLLNPHLPYIVYTAQKIEEYDGISATTSTMTYEYRGGDSYYSYPFERRFAGFGTTTATDAAGNITKTFFHQGNDSDSAHGEYSDHASKIGKPYRIEKYDASGNLYAKTVNKWDEYSLGAHRNFVKLLKATDFSYDGDSDHADKAEEYTYSDSTGNITQKIEWGRVTGSDDGSFSDSGSDKFTTAISYAASSTPYIIGRPSVETVTDQSAAKVKETKYYYDGLANGSVDKGNETKRELWKTAGTYIDIEHAYNAYGLMTQEKDPRDKATNFTYDPFNLYVATSTNPLSHVTGYVYDYSNGKPKRTITPNNLTFETVYDALDRIKDQKQPDLTTPSTSIIKTTYTYTDSAPRSVQKRENLDGSTSFDTYTYYDGLGRVVQERKEAEDTSTYAVRDLSYNNRGLLEKESLPYFSTGSSKTTATTSSAMLTTYTQDPLGRVTSIVNIIGTTNHSYDDWRATTTDPLGHAKGSSRDAYGNLARVDEHNSSAHYTTTYAYDYLRDLTKITDAAGNVRNLTYDGLARRLTAEDLHASGDATYGSWSYTYDDAGNVATSTNPEGKVVGYVYDSINRIIREDFTGMSGTEVAYAYDSCTYGKGLLCAATTTDAGLSYAYNPLGARSKEINNVNATHYVTQFEYDRQGNQTKITYPDSAEATYAYNTAGLLESVSRRESGAGSYTSVLTDLDYSPAGQITYQRFANGAETVREYDKVKLYRLKHLHTAFSGAGGAGVEEDAGFLIEVPEETLDLDPASSLPETQPEVTAESALSAIATPLEDATTPQSEAPTDANATTTPEVMTPILDEVSEASADNATSTPADFQSPAEDSAATSTAAHSESAPSEESSVIADAPMGEIAPLEEQSSVDVDAEALALAKNQQQQRSSTGDRQKLVITGKNANLLSALGISTARENKKYERVHLSRELQKELETRSWNSITIPLEATITKDETASSSDVIAEIIPTKQESEFHVKWMHYLSDTGWQEIDTRFEKTKDGFTMDKAPFTVIAPPRSTGTAIFHNNNKWDVTAQKEIEESPLDLNITAVDVADVPGHIEQGDLLTARGVVENASYVVYKNAYQDGDLIYYVHHGRAPRLEKLVRITREPTKLDYEFRIESSRSVSVATHEGTVSFDAGGSRGMAFSEFRAWDSGTQRRTILTDVVTKGPNEYSLIKHLPASLFHASTTYPVYTDTESTFYPNPDAESTSVDGWARRHAVDESFSTIRSASGTYHVDDVFNATQELSSSGTSNQWYQIVRIMTLFDTSSIPDANSVDSATYSVWANSKVDNATLDASVSAARPVPASNTDIVDSDYDIGNWTMTRQSATDIDLGSISTGAYNSFALNSTGVGNISKTGVTKLGVAFTDDLDNTAPAWASWVYSRVEWYMAEQSGTSNDPKLVVTHTVVNQAPTAPSSLQIEGQSDPISITDGKPEFSAIYNDPDSGDLAPYYRIQVSTSSLGYWSDSFWDSGTSTMATTTAGNRSPELSYGGSALASSTTYYWRILFSDDSRRTGAWSLATSTFSLAPAQTLTAGGIQNVYFTYDEVGNISQMQDLSDTATYKTLLLTYDDLYRLTSATTTVATTTQEGFRETYTYSSIGNLTSKSDLGSYTYAGDTGSLYANPHAATAINGVTQTYTKSGNLMGNGTWNYRWDYRGQLTRATSSASALSSFGYDYTGSRVYLKEGSQATTTFPNKLYSTQGATTTKHIYAGNQLIATVENTSGSGGSSGDTGLKSPSATGEDHNQWSTPSSAYASNNDYAFEDTLNHKQDYYNFTFGIPSGATINGIEVKLEAKDQEIATGVIGVELSHNGGTTYTSSGKDTGTLTGSDAVYTLGGSSDTWGRSWSDTEFSNTNFRLRVNADTLYLWLDHVQAKVYYTTGGSGATTTIAYVHTDHLGGTSAITNDHKEIIQTTDYYPFGAQRFNTQKTDFNERRKYTGYELDNSTGLNYAGARYQNPGEGRFTSQDPLFVDSPERFIADPQQMNVYAYARNNPLRYTDPNGEELVLATTVGILTAIVATLSLLSTIITSPQYQQLASQASHATEQVIQSSVSTVQSGMHSIGGSFVGVYSGPADSNIYIGSGTAASTPYAFPGSITQTAPYQSSPFNLAETKPGGLSGKEAKDKAGELGYTQKVKPGNAGIDTKGKPLFRNPKTGEYISPDRTGHKGGEWKQWDRFGGNRRTLDGNLNPIGN